MVVAFNFRLISFQFSIFLNYLSFFFFFLLRFLTKLYNFVFVPWSQCQCAAML